MVGSGDRRANFVDLSAPGHEPVLSARIRSALLPTVAVVNILSAASTVDNSYNIIITAKKNDGVSEQMKVVPEFIANRLHEKVIGGLLLAYTVIWKLITLAPAG